MVSQRIHPFYSNRPKMMFGSAPQHFANLRHVKRCKTCVSSLNALIQGIEVAKTVSQRIDPFKSIRTKMMFGSVLEHFAILRLVKRCETCISSLNALFLGNEVVKMFSQQKHPFYSIRPKMMFGSVLEHFANLRHVKRCKLVFRAWMHYYGVPKLRKLFHNKNTHSTPLDPKWCLGVLRSISQTFGMWKEAKLVFRA